MSLSLSPAFSNISYQVINHLYFGLFSKYTHLFEVHGDCAVAVAAAVTDSRH